MLPLSVPPLNVSVLLVDDEPDVLEFLHLLLTSKMQGATVDRADSGRAALERIVATDYDVVVSDVVMPGMSGLELLEKIRQVRPHTPVVLMTGFYERELIVRALRGGAFDFIEKPIDHDNFLATVTRAVQVRRLRSTVEEQKAALERQMDRIVEERTLALRNEITERKRVEGELHSALDRLRAVIGSSPIAIVSLDVQGRVTGWNQAAEHVFGWTEGEVLGRELPYLAPGQEQESETIWEQVMGGEGLGGLELRRLRKDGSPVDIAVWATRLFDQRGEVIGSMGLEVDVTERKRAEEALRMQARVLASMLEGVSLSDENGVILYTNPAEDAMFGYEPGELIGKHVTVLNTYPPEENARIVAGVIEKLKVQGSWEGEFSNRRKDGTAFTTFAHITALELAGKKHWVCVQEDITARKQAEEALRESEAFKNRILENSPDCIKVLDLEGRLLFMNKGGMESLEISGDFPLLNSQWVEFWEGEDKQKASKAVAVARAGGIGRFIGFYPTVTGKPKWWDVFITPILNVEGKPDRLLAISRDITEQRQAEAERRDLYERLQESHKGLRTLSQRLLEAQELERRRIARELHDETGQTLTSLLIGMRTLEEIPMREAVRERVSELRKTVARAINEIKRLALGLHPSVLDDLGLETALTRLTEEFIHAHGLMVDLQMNGLDEKRLPLVVETILYRIAQEALTNVAKHAGGARVSILLQCSPSAAKVIIEDDGRGFDVQAVLKSAGRSNHMGLHGMHERAALVNGSVEIESTPGGGTTIYVQVPIGRGSA